MNDSRTTQTTESLPNWVEQILQELEHQFHKFGEQNHSAGSWSLILLEELGEVSKAYLEHDTKAAKKELIQVAAVAISWLQALQRVEKGKNSREEDRDSRSF